MAACAPEQLFRSSLERFLFFGMTHMSWDNLMQVDTHALNEMAQTAFKSIDHVLGDLNDDLTAPYYGYPHPHNW